jgi:hypothetical protein
MNDSVIVRVRQSRRELTVANHQLDRQSLGRNLKTQRTAFDQLHRNEGFAVNFGTAEGEKEWVSGSKATPNEALGFFDFVVGLQRFQNTGCVSV